MAVTWPTATAGEGTRVRDEGGRGPALQPGESPPRQDPQSATKAPGGSCSRDEARRHVIT